MPRTTTAVAVAASKDQAVKTCVAVRGATGDTIREVSSGTTPAGLRPDPPRLCTCTLAIHGFHDREYPGKPRWESVVASTEGRSAPWAARRGRSMMRQLPFRLTGSRRIGRVVRRLR